MDENRERHGYFYLLILVFPYKHCYFLTTVKLTYVNLTLSLKTLGLKPMTRNMCYDFYIQLNSEAGTYDAIKESISWWQDNGEKLNNLWWVLNYYAEKFDPDRDLRACVERQLDFLAREKQTSLEPETPDP
ncbi:MAG: hypothetical protein B6230_00395 [Desulfobacteraceae bacterium 4572_89]|nr:MAG: hypothetical protein B6230_00395 [Desulfobacteraceae bacterium 4572_89]